jgi:hypothetical protein
VSELDPAGAQPDVMPDEPITLATFADEPDEHHTASAYISTMFGRRRVWTQPGYAAEMRRKNARARAVKAAMTRKVDAAVKAYKAGLGTAEAAIEAITRRAHACNSDERLLVMFATMGRVGPPPREIFWPVFSYHWSHCDDTWWCQDLLILALRNHAPAILSEDEQKVFDALPERVRVYRGCSRERIKGASWTTDRSVAVNFARGHRFIPVPDPVIATAMIAKADIFMTNSQRGEDEVLLDPDHLQELSVEVWVPKVGIK